MSGGNWEKLRSSTMRAAENVKDRIYSELEKDIRANADPPIQGEITSEKLRIRGIQVVRENFANRRVWAEQQGERITRVLKPTVDLGFGPKAV